jgi:phosphoglycolate phosphatase
MKELKNLLFDLDGTLVNSSRTIAVCIDYALDKLGAVPDKAPSVETWIGLPLFDIFRDHFGLEQQPAETAIAHYREHYEFLAQAGSEVYDGIHEALSGLREAGFRLYIATVKPTPVAEKVLGDLGLRAYFDGVAGASTGHERRDKASIIAHALAEFGLEPHRSLMIGDRDQDVLGARQNGLPCVAVTWGFGSTGELERAGPAFSIGHSRELVPLLLNPAVRV